MTDPLKDSPDTLKWFADRTMLGRLGNPESDLDGPLALLANSASNYITGQIIYVDGGWSAW
jgi:NAD(P)-dependent dehydrogenase (short-subunit alcohol dehydrogenase family)